MICVLEVKTKKQQKDFLNFPLNLYKNNPYFAPPLWLSEKKIFSPDYAYYDTCEAVYYIAYCDGKTVGRISAILQKESNKIRNEKRIRFTRFDCIDDKKVAKALFDTVEKWALKKGMDTVCGPLGFSDLEREGLLIEGFDQISTFSEQYNYEYYAKLIEACGYKKEVDWLERRVNISEKQYDKLSKTSDFIKKRYSLKPLNNFKSFKAIVERYKDKFFNLLDESYGHLYGAVPFNNNTKKLVIDNFNLIMSIADSSLYGVVVNEEDDVVGLGISYPCLTKALQKSKGHLTPLSLIRVIHTLRHPEILELGLIAIDSKYKGAGVIILDVLAKNLKNNPDIKHVETNLCLETNKDIQLLWGNKFDTYIHKRRRSYIKKLV